VNAQYDASGKFDPWFGAQAQTNLAQDAHVVTTLREEEQARERRDKHFARLSREDRLAKRHQRETAELALRQQWAAFARDEERARADREAQLLLPDVEMLELRAAQKFRARVADNSLFICGCVLAGVIVAQVAYALLANEEYVP
jgi:hypothetical protein